MTMPGGLQEERGEIPSIGLIGPAGLIFFQTIENEVPATGATPNVTRHTLG